jgi:hypothetical protein
MTNEVMFEWADGPNAAAASRSLKVFDEEGNEISPRMETKEFHKNGKWSYNDVYVFVPAGSIILEQSSNTHGHKVKKFWIAAAGRPVIVDWRGSWTEGSTTWPYTPKELDPLVYRRILEQCVPEKAQAYWNQNKNVTAI